MITFGLMVLELPCKIGKIFDKNSSKYFDRNLSKNLTIFLRIYHVKISTKERWVYMEEGYSPSEPGFMKNPSGTEDDDGIVVTVMSPFHDPELR